ncbi:hypothetical protein Q3G72_023807 [Acer saccharum]|nr:hypothetical protein Q3G72_023807 [Acer saccharum]
MTPFVVLSCTMAAMGGVIFGYDIGISMLGADASWLPPEVGCFKLNVHAAVDASNGRVGVGLVLRDYAGIVLASSVQPIQSPFSALVAEALAILRGLHFAFDTGLFPCTLESDAKVVVDLVNSRNVPCAEVGLIIGDICNFIVTHPGCKFVFVPRKANMVAHSLARLSLSYGSDLFLMEEVSYCVLPVVLGDCPG